MMALYFEYENDGVKKERKITNWFNGADEIGLPSWNIYLKDKRSKGKKSRVGEERQASSKKQEVVDKKESSERKEKGRAEMGKKKRTYDRTT